MDELHERLMDKLKIVDDYQGFLKYVLLSVEKNRSTREDNRYNKGVKMYSSFITEYKYTISILTQYGFINRVLDVKTGVHLSLTNKGKDALRSWSRIECFKPNWLSENKKFAISTSIAVLAFALSLFALFL